MLDFPQAPIKFDIYMKLPRGIEIDAEDNEKNKCVLKLLKNLYGQKQASRQFCQYVNKKTRGFTMSAIEECMFFKKGMIFVIYVDDGTLFIKDPTQLKDIFPQFQREFEVEQKGDVQQFLGMNFAKSQNGISITQTHLINQIIKDLNLRQQNCKL